MSDAPGTRPRTAPARPKALPADRRKPPIPTAGPPAVERPDAPPARPAPWATLWLTDRDIAVFTALAAIVLALLVLRWAQLSGWGREEIVIERLQPLEVTYRLDLNTATWVEFSQLPEVGEALALRIVEHREKHGPYRSVDDLDAVKGIGPKTLEDLRPYVRVVPESNPAQ